MERRKFIKGLSLLSLSMFIPVSEIDIKSTQENYQLFCNIFEAISGSLGIPKSILTGNFSKEYSLSKDILLREWKYIREERLKLNE